MTNEPLIACLCMLGVFCFTTLTFILYDRYVERRQRLVMKSAKESGDVVSKLFPAEVRDRLYQENEAKDTKRSSANAKGQCQFLASTKRSSLTNSTLEASSRSDPLQGASPIADEYPDCTVFFADLAGFTQWSSTRTPSEVFLLLEVS